VPAIEGDRALEEVDRRLLPLVREHLRVGEAAVVVDADVHALVADVVAALALEVGPGRVGVGDAGWRRLVCPHRPRSGRVV
jgi:hypothetical protein